MELTRQTAVRQIELTRRPQQRRIDSIYRETQRLTWRRAPASPRGRAGPAACHAGRGRRAPLKRLCTQRRRGPNAPTGRSPGPATCERGPRAPLVRPRIERGHLLREPGLQPRHLPQRPQVLHILHRGDRHGCGSCERPQGQNHLQRQE